MGWVTSVGKTDSKMRRRRALVRLATVVAMMMMMMIMMEGGQKRTGGRGGARCRLMQQGEAGQLASTNRQTGQDRDARGQVRSGVGAGCRWRW